MSRLAAAALALCSTASVAFVQPPARLRRHPHRATVPLRRAAAAEPAPIARDAWELLDVPPPAVPTACTERLLRDVHAAVHGARSAAAVARLSARAAALADDLEPPPDLDHLPAPLASARVLGAALRRLAAVLDPALSKPALERRLAPVYEEICSQLRHHGRGNMPVMRRIKKLRTLYHVASGLSVVAMVHATGRSPAAFAFRRRVSLTACAVAWTTEALKSRVPRSWIKRLQRILGPIAHESEFYGINSASWFMTALAVLTWSGIPLDCGCLGVVALSVGDPAAAFVGSRYGRVRLYGKKTLEGTAAFAGATGACGFALLAATAPVPRAAAAAAAAAAAVAGALAELYATALPVAGDDNLTVPVAGALAGWAALAAMGLAGG